MDKQVKEERCTTKPCLNQKAATVIKFGKSCYAGSEITIQPGYYLTHDASSFHAGKQAHAWTHHLTSDVRILNVGDNAFPGDATASSVRCEVSLP